MDDCPICGHDLYLLACKRRCPNCNYYEDCSDLWLPNRTPPPTRDEFPKFKSAVHPPDQRTLLEVIKTKLAQLKAGEKKYGPVSSQITGEPVKLGKLESREPRKQKLSKTALGGQERTLDPDVVLGVVCLEAGTKNEEKNHVEGPSPEDYRDMHTRGEQRPGVGPAWGF